MHKLELPLNIFYRVDKFSRDEKRNTGQMYLVMATIICKQKFGRGFYVGRKNTLCIAFLKGNQLQFIWGFRLIILSEFNPCHFIWCRMFSIPMCQVQTVPFELDTCQKNFVVKYSIRILWLKTKKLGFQRLIIPILGRKSQPFTSLDFLFVSS